MILCDPQLLQNDPWSSLVAPTLILGLHHHHHYHSPTTTTTSRPRVELQCFSIMKTKKTRAEKSSGFMELNFSYLKWRASWWQKG
jgi:hypothetical protein